MSMNATSPPPPPSNTTNSTSPSAPPPEDVVVLSSPPPPVNGSTPAPSSRSSSRLPAGALAGLIAGVALGAITVLICVGIFVCFRKRKKRKAAQRHSLSSITTGPKDHLDNGLPQLKPKANASPGNTPLPPRSPVLNPTSPEPPPATSSLVSEKTCASPSPCLGLSQSFTYDELARATDNFLNTNLLGQGGFGYVYKGVLSDGKVVAIKQHKAGSRQGEREFQAEIDTISHVHHRHLVSLVGYCITSSEQSMVVLEFVPNKTLEFHLHGSGQPTMGWSTRMKIAIGSAKGLAYLHEECHPKIIHRDIKAANILLDNNFEAKVADFGLAKYSLETDTHVSTRVMGTFGYMAPEYASTGKLTEKSDVFSYGVVLLELITGRRPVDRHQAFVDDSIVDWARPLLKQAIEVGNYDALADPKLQKAYDPNEMARMVYCAAACVRHSSRFRPGMGQIVRALEGGVPLDDLTDGMTPGHSSVYDSDAGSSKYSSDQQKDDLKKHWKTAFRSQQLDSGENDSGLITTTSSEGQLLNSSSTEGQQTSQKTESKDTKEHAIEHNPYDGL